MERPFHLRGWRASAYWLVEGYYCMPPREDREVRSRLPATGAQIRGRASSGQIRSSLQRRRGEASPSVDCSRPTDSRTSHQSHHLQVNPTRQRCSFSNRLPEAVPASSEKAIVTGVQVHRGFYSSLDLGMGKPLLKLSTTAGLF